MSDMTRRSFLRSTAAASAALAIGGTAAGAWASPANAATTGTRPFLAYKTNSYFRTPLGSAPAVDAARTATFRNFMKTHVDQKRYAYPRINGVEGNKWGTAYAMGTAGDPVWKLTGSFNSRADLLKTQGFRAPDWLGSMLTGTNDSPLCVIDTVGGFTMFCANAAVVGPRTIKATAGAVTYHSSNGLHFKHPSTDDKRNFTSRGRISDAMVIRQDLVEYGVKNGTDLGHVLHLFIAESRTSDGHTGPMVGSESGKYGFGAEGERIAIAPTVDVTKRGLSPQGLVIARTLQRYGMYIGDNAGTASALKAEQETTGRPVWGGTLGRDSLKGLTWDDFVVVR
jgi:hypothetical protein